MDTPPLWKQHAAQVHSHANATHDLIIQILALQLYTPGILLPF